MSTARAAELTWTSRANAFITLTKPDVSFLVLMTTAAGYYMGARGPMNWLHLMHTVFATMLIAAGTATLNNYIERDSDRFMRRTASRPLPTGVIQPREALLFGVALSVAGAIDLYIVGGPWACGLGVATCLSYLLAYTPLKKRTVWATFIGAFPGAIPPMICRGSEILKVRAEGVPVGLLESREYEEITFQTQAGDTIVLYSDGITDHLNAAGAEYGRGRLAQVVRSGWRLTAAEMVATIFAELDKFNTTAFDDQTVFVMKVK